MPDGASGNGDGKSLDWKDYVALFIALLQTIALPLLLLIVVIIAAVEIPRLLH